MQELKARYPDWRSATLPALQLAQEKHGYLSPEALRETAAALGTTPAFCESVASFYDMLHLRPVGRHMVEVCTNLPCALVGAQRVVDALEEALGVAAGETTKDGEITFRTVECLGGCGYATVVAVDERYHQFMTPEKVADLLEELRASCHAGKAGMASTAS